MSIETRRMILGVLLPLLIQQGAGAWEVESAVPLPSPVGELPGAVRMTEAALDVNGDEVTIRYALVSESGEREASTLAIYGSLFTWEGVGATYSDKQFPELIIRSGKLPVHVKTTVTAFHHGVDVSKRIRSAGLNPLLVAGRDDAFILANDKLRKGAYARLIKDRLLRPADGVLIPNWFAQVSYSWVQSFEPEKTTEVSVQYRLRPGFKPLKLGDKELGVLLASHCASLDQLEQALMQDKSKVLPEYVLAQEFEIPIGVGSAAMTDAVQLSFMPSKLWAGLKPAASFVCKDGYESIAAEGLPFLPKQTIRLIDKRVSVLLILPQ
jgi:hypothetical protein